MDVEVLKNIFKDYKNHRFIITTFNQKDYEVCGKTIKKLQTTPNLHIKTKCDELTLSPNEIKTIKII